VIAYPPDATLLPAEQVKPGPNDRTVFDEVELRALAENIRLAGLLNPPVVRPLATGEYEIVGGERRTRAMRDILRLSHIPCVVRHMDDRQASNLMLAENTARADLSPLDEARAYANRQAQYGATLGELATIAGRSERTIANRLKLLELAPDLAQHLANGVLPLAIADVLVKAEYGKLGRDDLQRIGFRIWRDKAGCTPDWLKSKLAELVEAAEQAVQGGLFDDWADAASELADDLIATPATEPGVPGRDDPPFCDDLYPRDRLLSQADWWDQQAHQWRHGHAHKRHAQRCADHAASLRLAAKHLPEKLYTADEFREALAICQQEQS
jgi:ParB/RepB/Spo0J family partition protein